MNGNNFQKEFGDYQTPINFTNAVCNYLKKEMKLSPTVIIEPTCGIGNFLISSFSYFGNSTFFGIEVSRKYLEEAKHRLDDKNITWFNNNLFEFDFKHILDTTNNLDRVLIIGNPPWVNNSTLSALDSNNTPFKSNFKGLKGLDAITGSANFDICEYMILQLISNFKNTNTTIAMVCKTTVARNVFMELKRNSVSFDLARILIFDAKKIFNVSVDSCLLLINMTFEENSKDYCEVYNFSEAQKIISSFGYRGDKFYSDLNNDSVTLDGQCCFEWRQGVKHDCSKIMELTKTNGSYINGIKEEIEIEDTFVFPLVKSSGMKTNIITETKKHVIVTQKKAREDTSYIKNMAPKTWNYLSNHVSVFIKRKSSIYKNAPQFSMFGVGDYSYLQYKVGISGFYKNPVFALMYAHKPVMMDDTCYFIGFENYKHAYTAMLILNSDLVQKFLKSIAFIDSKRPYTKKVLERIDFSRCISKLTFDELLFTESKLKLCNYLTNEMYEDFKILVSHEVTH